MMSFYEGSLVFHAPCHHVSSVFVCNATAGVIVRRARCRFIEREVISGLQLGDE